ncbi:MAG: hypothetical protein ACR2NO_03915 [Chloroflexota bacterium]
MVAPPVRPAPGSAAKHNVTAIQQQILQGLLRAGGASAYKQLFRACYGLRWEDMPSVDRSRMGVSVRGLEKKGMVEISRRWGTGGYGQPEAVEITEVGRAVAKSL